MKRTGTFVVCCIIVTCLTAQTPKQGAKLNYTQVMFEHDQVKGAGSYILQVAEQKPRLAFDSIFSEIKSQSEAALVTGLQFGKKYQWRYAPVIDGQQKEWYGPYSFEITTDEILDMNLYGLNVTVNDTGSNAGGLIVNDFTHTIYDRAGKPVWFMPKQDLDVQRSLPGTFYAPAHGLKNVAVTSITNDVSPIFNLNVTGAGTITYLTAGKAFECSIDGNILWTAPDNGTVSGGTAEGYNHDFKRLPNGDYMILGEETLRKLPAYTDTAAMLAKWPQRTMTGKEEYAKVNFGTVIEYNSEGKVVWSWNSEKYFDKDVLSPLKDAQQLNHELDAHINAFCTDSSDKFVYVGFRNISRVVKIQKSTGKVVDSWGISLPQNPVGEPVSFHGQHGACLLKDGSLAVFNDNDCTGTDSIAEAVIFSQRPEDKGKILWKYVFSRLGKCDIRTGGSVEELSNGNLLVCTGTLNCIAEITRSKKIVWQASVTTPPAEKDRILRLNTAHYISSLYPCYFTLRVSTDTVISDTPGFSATIFNNGTESDSYRVKAWSSSGSYLKGVTTKIILPGSSFDVLIIPGTPLKPGDNIELTVTSCKNPGFMRKKEIKVVSGMGG